MMKKLSMLIGILVMGLMLAGCGAQKNDLDLGHDLAQNGDCAGAQPYLDSTIASPDDLMDMALAYYIKGECANKVGDAATAYENYYAAKVVVCYAIAHDTHINLNTYGRSEYCQRIIPQKLKELEPNAGDVQAIRDKVDTALHERYLERFATGTN